jgi:tetratricopeptide (TPR) repeat protein
MASLIPGYEYDIFISYRQKDNKYDGWVTEFVENLKKELEATFKEDVSVYFDINPHDGLLETHDVDASLKEKLKCLLFIPIISRTYCDPRSFAWEHEFKVFVEQASQDKFGLKVKLPNGNVASRVLPIQIHEIAAEDKAHIEKELGGILRPIEFIYKEPGVNRPLRGNEDHPDNNLNKTVYRNQINKVANAIDEIIYSMKNFQTAPLKDKPQHLEPLEEVRKEEKKEMQVKPDKISKRRLLSGIGILTVLIVASILAYPKLFKRDTLERLRSSGDRISVAVFPFLNMTNDTLWNIWQDGIKDILINSLASTEYLIVRPTESINSLIQGKSLTNYKLITPSVASTISQLMDAKVLVLGSINQEGPILRINAQLIDSKTKEILQPFQIDGSTLRIIPTIDSLALMVRNYLIISKLGKEVPGLGSFGSGTNSPEAFGYYTKGLNAFMKRDYQTARDMLSIAIKIDTNYIDAILQLSFAYGNPGNYEMARKVFLKAYQKRAKASMDRQILMDWNHAFYFETPKEEIRILNQLLDDQKPSMYYQLADAYELGLHQYKKSIPLYNKALEIYKKWGSKPGWIYSYTNLGKAYHETRNYKKEKMLYKKAEQDYPNDQTLISRQAILALTKKDMVAANRYIEKYISLRKEDPEVTEAAISISLAGIYSEAEILDKAEEYYRKALSLEPDNASRMNSLAYFIIDKDRNINEGLQLIDTALKINPISFNFLHTKGWGLFKQGKYKEAFEILQKSWDIRREKARYNHEAFIHLEAAKNAVAELK